MAQRWSSGLALLAGVLLLAAAPAGAADLVLKRVVLSTGGVGYFEYEAQVAGDASLGLDVPLDQVDDVLKSLVVYDGGGTAGEVTLPGREPLTQGFVDLPFDRSALNSEVDLLNALQGAEIKVAAPKAIEGRLVHVDTETVTSAPGAAEIRIWVSVLTGSGLQRFALQAVDAIGFADPKLQAQVETALQRIAAYRDQGRRRLTLQLHGKGPRTVEIGYVVAMPLWKASYRMTLPADPKAETARLQGWAVLENFSGRPWQDVELTLLSGNPVTFRQALYESYWVPRPTVPVESGNRVLPPPDTGTMATAQAAKAASPAFRMNRAAPGAAREMAGAAAPAPPPPAPLEGAAANEEATQIAFTPPYRVSVEAGQSLMLPLLDRELPARRVDLYQPSVDRQHPLAAIELTNAGGTGLPPGVLTLYQQRAGEGALYVGDARLASLPAGDKRLLSFAVDNRVSVARTTASAEPVVSATIVDGTLHLKRALRWTTRYQVKAAASPPPALLIEQPRQPGATLTQPDPKGVALTAGAYRIPLIPGTDGKASLTVVEERPVEEAIGLLDVADNRLAAFAASAELDPKVRQALAGIATRRQAIARQRAELQRARDKRAQLADDEKRLRDKLGVLGGEPDLRKRMLDQFAAAETAIEKLAATIDGDTAALGKAEQDLRSYVSGLNL